MKKIAIPTDGGKVDSHFGHCQYYTIVTVGNDNTVLTTERMDSPQGCGCKSNIAPILANHGVEVMLSGGIGQGARNVLNNAGIEVFSGYSGAISEVVEDYLSNGYKGQNDTCAHNHDHGHDHDHQCGNH